jgi:hypothetical protein
VQQFTDQRLVLHEISNHAEFREKLFRLGLTSDFAVLQTAVTDVIRSWFQLARQHAEELGKISPTDLPRTVYSRSYYAAYNASKAVRYASRGIVSLRGDDHRKVSELPESFPDVDSWARNLQLMYEHRLRADYDNWTQTPNEHTLKPEECAGLAQRFLTVCETFLNNEHKIQI